MDQRDTSAFPLTRRAARATLSHKGRGSLRKHAVQEPARRGGALGKVAIEPGAEQPEAKSCLVFHAKIIASRSAVLAPPGALDALRSVGRAHLVQRAPPAEAQRRPV